MHTINTKEELLNIKDMSLDYKLGKDIDLKGVEIAPIGTKEKPFTGTFDGAGYKIKNLKIKNNKNHIISLFGVNKGRVINLDIESMHILNDFNEDTIVSTVVGINYGEVSNVNVKKSKIKITQAKNTLNASTLVGINYGKIQNTNSDVLVSINSNDGEVLFGSIVSKSELGLIETCETFGEIELKGKNVKAGMFGYVINNTVMRASTFSAPFNSINGEVFINFIYDGNNNEFDGNIYRDNRNDDRLIPKNNLKVRKKVLEYYYEQATIPWVPSRDVGLYRCSCGSLKFHAKQRFPKGSKQYGLPYTHNNGSLERFKYCFDEKGNLKPFVKGEGYDGFDLYIGNDCSTSICWAWNRISDSVDFTLTGDERPCEKRGTIIVGDYDWDHDETTKELINRNGIDKIAEGLALLRIGDGMVSWTPGVQNHTRMISHSSIVYRHEDGDLDLVKSKTISCEQGNGLMYDPPVQKQQSMLIDFEYTFLELLRTFYIPITIPNIKDGIISEAHLKYSGDKEGYDGMFEGYVESNYRIVYTTMQLFDEKGKKIFDKVQFTGLRANTETEDDPENDPRESHKKVELKMYKPFKYEFELKKGKTYTYKFYTYLSNGINYETRNYKFKA